MRGLHTSKQHLLCRGPHETNMCITLPDTPVVAVWCRCPTESDFDGGDCCECTCVGTVDFTCGGNGGFDCIDPGAPCQGNLVEAGTKTTIGASTNTYDTRAGEALGGVGCGEDGCEAQLTRDESVAVESRWACAQKLDPDAGPCEIVFAFEEPQDILEVQVAFFKGDERSRTLQVRGMCSGNTV